MPEENKEAEQPIEEEKKNKFVEWLKEHPKSVFWFRFVLWAIFSAILPFSFIAWRYGIFSSQPKIQLNGWGIIGIIIVLVFAITLIRYMYKGLKPGLAKQCIFGFVSIILPLVILLLLITSIEDSVRLFKQALACVIVCELVGIPLNPLPTWLEEKREKEGKEKADELTDLFWDKFFKKKEEKNKDNE